MESIRKVDAGELSYEDVCRKLNTNIETGLDWNEANRRLQIVGHNELNVKQEESLLSKYIEQVAFHSFLMIVVCYFYFFFVIKKNNSSLILRILFIVGIN